jgi:flagellar biosynthetic protein FliR
VIDLSPETVLAVFLIFCRIGGCLLVIPGFSSNHVPMKVRLFIAIVVALSLTPMLIPLLKPHTLDQSPANVLRLTLAELGTGLLIGFIGRVFFAALQTIAMAATNALGLGGMPGAVPDENEQSPTLVTLFTLTATVLLFATDQHWELLRGLVDSYRTIPAGQGIVSRLALVDVTDQFTAAFLLALRIGSPFLIYSVVFNFAIGVTNKMTPQIPVFFIAMPFVTAGGMFLLYFTVSDFMTNFHAAFATWLSKG